MSHSATTVADAAATHPNLRWEQESCTLEEATAWLSYVWENLGDFITNAQAPNYDGHRTIGHHAYALALDMLPCVLRVLASYGTPGERKLATLTFKSNEMAYEGTRADRRLHYDAAVGLLVLFAHQATEK